MAEFKNTYILLRKKHNHHICISLNIGLSGDRFHFDMNGDGPARYNIIHFKQDSLGKYRWVKVGEYNEGELRLNMSGNC